jgi:hypothetical protein
MLHPAVRVTMGRVAAWFSRLAPVRFMALPPEDRRLLVRALAMVLVVRLALWLVPVSRLHPRLVTRRVEIAELPREQAERLAWAVSAVASRVPSATCLTRALALQGLLSERGSLSRVHVGLFSRGPGDVRGHAWLEWRGEVLLGGGEISSFSTVMTLNG